MVSCDTIKQHSRFGFMNRYCIQIEFHHRFTTSNSILLVQPLQQQHQLLCIRVIEMTTNELQRPDRHKVVFPFPQCLQQWSDRWIDRQRHMVQLWQVTGQTHYRSRHVWQCSMQCETLQTSRSEIDQKVKQMCCLVCIFWYDGPSVFVVIGKEGEFFQMW